MNIGEDFAVASACLCIANTVASARRRRRHRRMQVFLSVLNKLKSYLRKPPEGSLVIQLYQKSPRNCIKLRARSKLLRYRGDNCTKIALKSQLVYTCDLRKMQLRATKIVLSCCDKNRLCKRRSFRDQF